MRAFPKVPILFLIFNRPNETEKVLQSIKEYQPERIYIASDGARDNKPGEADIVQKTRSLVLEAIDWPCEVKTLFRDANLGCGPAVSQAISWYFQHEEYGIILEDDCLAAQPFYHFCEELLVKHKDNDRVWQINGFNPFGSKIVDSHYDFSIYPKIWGWATWARAWKKNDFLMKDWPMHRSRLQHLRVMPIYEALIRARIWNTLHAGISKTGIPKNWGPQWGLSILMNNGLCISPRANLIKNIGIGADDATNCTNKAHPYQYLDFGTLNFPVEHPSEVAHNRNLDRRISIEFLKQRFRELNRKMRS